MNEFFEILAILGTALGLSVISGVTGIIVNRLYRDKYSNRKKYLESCISSYPCVRKTVIENVRKSTIRN